MRCSTVTISRQRRCYISLRLAITPYWTAVGMGIAASHIASVIDVQSCSAAMHKWRSDDKDETSSNAWRVSMTASLAQYGIISISERIKTP